MCEPWNGSDVPLEVAVSPKAIGTTSVASFFLRSPFPISNHGVLEAEEGISSYADNEWQTFIL